jgi:hypothetical protein
MRYGGILGVIVLVWLLIGAYAAYERDYFTSGNASCSRAADIALTIIAGPVNWKPGVNPKVNCSPNIPPPSSMGAVHIKPPLEVRS